MIDLLQYVGRVGKIPWICLLSNQSANRATFRINGSIMGVKVQDKNILKISGKFRQLGMLPTVPEMWRYREIRCLGWYSSRSLWVRICGGRKMDHQWQLSHLLQRARNIEQLETGRLDVQSHFIWKFPVDCCIFLFSHVLYTCWSAIHVVTWCAFHKLRILLGNVLQRWSCSIE